MLIYKITNDVNGKQYIGQTTKTLEHRWKQHQKNAKCGSTYALYTAIRKYGVEHFHVEQIDSACSRMELDQKEIYWIATLNTLSPSGYNLSEGGNVPTWTDDVREKLSGKNHWTNRKSFSQEALRKKHDALYQKPSGRSKAVRCVETGEICSFAKEFYYKYGHQHSKILECCKGRRNTHHGLHWEYA